MSHLNTSGNDSRFNFLQNGNNVSLPKPISILMLASLQTKVTWTFPWGIMTLAYNLGEFGP